MTKLLLKLIIWLFAINMLLGIGFSLGWGIMAGVYNYSESKGR